MGGESFFGSTRTFKGTSINPNYVIPSENLSVNSIIPFRAACDAAREGSDGDKEAGKEAGGLMGGNR